MTAPAGRQRRPVVLRLDLFLDLTEVGVVAGHAEGAAPQ